MARLGLFFSNEENREWSWRDVCSLTFHRSLPRQLLSTTASQQRRCTEFAGNGEAPFHHHQSLNVTCPMTPSRNGTFLLVRVEQRGHFCAEHGDVAAACKHARQVYRARLAEAEAAGK